MNTELEIRKQLIASIEGLKACYDKKAKELELEREKNTKLNILITSSNHILDLHIRSSQGKVRQSLMEVSKTLNLQA